MAGEIILDEGAAPSTPSTGFGTAYVKTDGLWYSKDDAGNEYILSGAQTTGYPTVTSAATVDIFGAAGVTVAINNSTPVTTTAFTACTTAQAGSSKMVIPAQAWTVTASASLKVDGATSGSYVMPAEARLEVLATSTTTFEIYTKYAAGTYTPTYSLAGGTGITITGSYKKYGRRYFVAVNITGTGLSSTAGVSTVSTPVASLRDEVVIATNAGATSGGIGILSSSTAYLPAITSTTGIAINFELDAAA